MRKLPEFRYMWILLPLYKNTNDGGEMMSVTNYIILYLSLLYCCDVAIRIHSNEITVTNTPTSVPRENSIIISLPIAF